MEVINSVHNPKLKWVRALQLNKKRRTIDQAFVIEGEHWLQELISSGIQPLLVLYAHPAVNSQSEAWLKSLEQAGVSCWPVAKTCWEQVTATITPQGWLAVMPQLHYRQEDLWQNDRPGVVIVDGIQDPGNLGTIIRTAAAAGSSGVILTRGTVDLYNPKTVRATMGALLRIPVVVDAEAAGLLASLQQADVRLVVADPEGETVYHQADLGGALALVVGNEARGPSPILLAGAQTRVRLPLANRVESLNVAVACGVILYERIRQQTTC